MKPHHKYLSFIIYFLLLLFISSCKKDKPAPALPDLGYTYFPLNIGSWIIYDVDSVVHDDFKDSVFTYKYQLKEFIESKYTDNAGKEIYRVERYKRNNPTAPWIISDVWAAHINSSRAEKFEENIWYIKLIFPVKENAKWNGNSFNSMDAMEYEYTEVNVSTSLNGNNFDSTLTVLQADELNAINKLFSEEKYAKNVGLIYRQYINLDLQKDSGLELTMKINSYGTQ